MFAFHSKNHRRAFRKWYSWIDLKKNCSPNPNGFYTKLLEMFISMGDHLSTYQHPFGRPFYRHHSRLISFMPKRLKIRIGFGYVFAPVLVMPEQMDERGYLCRMTMRRRVDTVTANGPNSILTINIF